MSRAELIESLFNTWDIAEEGFPTGGTPWDKLHFLLHYALLAPSSHNSQPWLFRVRDNYVELYADRTRALPVVDPDDRELIISCGAALFQLCIAMRHFGHEDVVEVFPNLHDSDLLARVGLGGAWVASPAEEELFHAIVRRRTNRMPFFNRRVPDSLLSELEEAAEKQGAWLYIVRREDDRRALATLIAEADRIQWSDKAFRRELAAWVHPSRSMSSDGIPGYAMGYSDLMSVAGPIVIRTFDLGNGQAARDQQLAEGSPVLAVLNTADDIAPEWLRAGEALSRVLLRATVDGVSASFLDQPIEVPGMRGVLSEILDKPGYPQLILRLGYGPEAMATPRRPLGQAVF